MNKTQLDKTLGTIKNYVDDITIGGVNLFSGTKGLTNGLSSSSYKTTETYRGFTVMCCDNTSGTGTIDAYQFGSSIKPKPSTYYTLSFYAKGSGSFTSYFYPNTCASSSSSTGSKGTAEDGSTTLTMTSAWKKYWITWKTLSTLDGESTKNVIVTRVNKGAKIYVCGVKFEEGNRATDWSPSLSEISLSNHTHSYLPLSGGTLTGGLEMGANNINFTNSDTGDIIFNEGTTQVARIWQNSSGLMIASGSNVSNNGTGVINIPRNSNALTIGGNKIYHAGSKPTPADIGAQPAARSINFQTNHVSDWTSAAPMSGLTYAGGWHGSVGTDAYLSFGNSGNTKLHLFVDGDIYAQETKKVYHEGNKPTPADIGAAAASHGTHVSYGGNGSASTVSRSDHTHSYIPLAGSTAITGVLRSNSEFQTTSQTGFRIASTYGTMLRSDSTSTYFLLTNKDDPYGNWNSLRPFTINNSTGAVSFGHGITGSLSGNASTATKLQTARTINGTSFDGSGNITTANWGTKRKINQVEVNGSADVKIPLDYYSCSVANDNTKNYHHILESGQCTSDYTDKSITIYVAHHYNSAGFGIAKCTLRTNQASTGATASGEIKWLVRAGIAEDALCFNIRNTAKDTYMDVFYKSPGTYASLTWYVLSEGSRGNNSSQWTKNSTHVANNVKVYTETNMKAIRSYTATLQSAVDNGAVSSAKTATKLATARTISLGGVLSGSATFDGSANAKITAALANGPKSGDWWNGGPVSVNSDGVMEAGKYLDFHHTDTTTKDYSVRLQTNGDNANTVSLPTGTGTLALTTDNVASATKLKTARSITIGNKSNNFDGSGNISFTLADIGAAASSHGTHVGGKTIDGSFSTAFRTQTKGNANQGDFISVVRCDTASVANAPQYGTGIAWGRADTHGYLYMPYNGGKAYIGAGSADKLNFIKEICFTDHNHDSTYAKASHGTHVSYGGNGSATTVSRSDHTHSYLPLAGGTMTGNITFTGVTSTTYPAKSNTITWSGSTDGADIYYQVDASDKGRLVLNTRDDADCIIMFANNGTSKSTIDNSGNFSGKAATAGTADTAKACSGNAATATKLATARTLTIGSKGKTFDGSGNVSWTLDEIGAAPKSHTHNYAGSSSAGGAANSSNVLNSNSRMDYGWNGLNYFNISGTAGNAAKANDTPTTAWWHIIRCNHGNSAGFYTDIAVPFNAQSMYYKRISNGAVQDGGWVKVLDAKNFGEYAAAKSHGTHVTYGGNGSATTVSRSDHTHNYAGSGSAGGSANSAVKLATARTISLTGDVTGSASFDGSANASITATVANDSHTHSTYLPKAGGTMTGAITSNVSTGTYLLTQGSGGIKKVTDQGGLLLHCDSSLFLHAGDNGATIAADAGAAADLTSENINLLADGSISIAVNTQSGYASATKFTINTNGFSGNAGTATKLKTGRKISLTGDVTGNATFDGSGDISITATVADNSHNHKYAGSSSAGGTANSAARVDVSRLTGSSNSANYQPGANRLVVREYGSDCSNMPSAHWYHIYTGQGEDANYNTQLAVGMTTSALYYRNRNSGTWGSWTKVATTAAATTSANGLMTSAMVTKLNGIAEGANKYSLPNATSSTLGGVKVGSNITVSSGTISLTKNNVTAALGYTPPTTNTTYSAATTSANGLMTAAMVTKLNGIAEGANKYTHPTSEGNKHVPSGGSSGNWLKWSSAGTATWGSLPSASTSASGIVKLSSSTSGTSETVAATEKAVKAAYDKGNHSHPYLSTSGGTMTGNITINNGKYITYKDKDGTARTVFGLNGSNNLHIGNQLYDDGVAGSTYLSSGTSGMVLRTKGGDISFNPSGSTKMKVTTSGAVFYGEPTLTCSTADTNAYYAATRSDTSCTVKFGVGAGGSNHGLYSSTLNAWIVYGDKNNKVVKYCCQNGGTAGTFGHLAIRYGSGLSGASGYITYSW